MKNRNELEQILKAHLQELRKDYGVKRLGLFGSYVQGSAHEQSDVDMLVEFHTATDLLSFVHLKNHLSDLIGIPVDLVMKKALKPHIGKEILKEVVFL